MTTQTKPTKTLSPTLTNQLNQLTTLSSKIRLLHQNNLSRSEISNLLKIRYQHVRNVLITPVKNPK